VIAWIAAGAWACEPLAPQVVAAREAVDDAEITIARSRIEAAYRALPCQELPVATADLLALYRLDGVVALAADDSPRAVYAVLRAAAVDPLRAIDADRDGPDLAALYATYAPPLAASLVTIAIEDGGTGWIDGRPLRAGAPIRVAKGEHLFQLEGPAGLATSVERVSTDRALRTGILGGAPPPAPPGIERRIDFASRAVWISGLVVGAAGGALLGVAWRAEQAFEEESYQDPTYGGCERAAPCWGTNRTGEIRADARRIRLFYGAGYGLAGAGAALVVGGATGAAIRPQPAVRVGGVW